MRGRLFWYNYRMEKFIAKAATAALSLALLGQAGCYSIKLDSHGDKVSRPVASEWFCHTVWGGAWWGESPEQCCRLAPSPDWKVNTHGFRRVEITGCWWSVPVSVLTLGVCVPVHVECYEAIPDERGASAAAPLDL